MNCLFLALALLILGCQPKSSSPPKDTAYFIPVPFLKISPLQAPCLKVELENATVSLELDLGFQGDLTIDPEQLDNIASKTFLQTILTHGIQGKAYKTDVYRVPQVHIGPLVFIEPKIQSNSHAFTRDSVFVKQGTASQQEVGRIGWQLFQHTPLLIDVAKETLAICDSLATLQEHGYEIEQFSQAKLLTDRGLLEFIATTEQGPLRCTLDTGASINVIHATTNQSIQESIWDAKKTVIATSFVIGNQNFGPLGFRSIPIQMPIPIMAILGMEFFREHVIFLDFSQGKIYFLKISNEGAS